MSAAAPGRLFGTDGIRAPFGEAPLDPPTVAAVAAGLAAALAERRGDGSAPLVILGGDPRDSSPILAGWLAGGLTDAGVRVRYVGVLPTPGIGRLVADSGADAGVAVSASHNPWPDNGIKLLDRDGGKWSAEDEAALELRVARLGAVPPTLPGSLALDPTGAERYLEILQASLPGDRPLAGQRVALDPGHGAASALAGPLFARLGAEASVLHAAPDGRNINAGCGSTAPEELAARVAAGGFDLGFAFDGDADRAVLVDERGEVRDGDALLYLWASDLAAAGRLVPRRIVATSMSNFGLERALATQGIDLVRSDVGDREVMATLRREGILLGGEQSGHLVHRGLAATGDGLLTAIQIAALIVRGGRPVSDRLAGFSRFPQILRAVRVASKRPFAELPGVAAARDRVQSALGGAGRLVLRYSGTEPVARIMIEGPDAGRIEELAAELAAAVAAEAGEGVRR